MLYYIMKTVVHTCCLLSFFYFPSPSYDEIPRLSWFPNKYAVPFRPMHAAICVQCRAMHHDDFLPRTSDRPGYSLAHRGRTLHNLFVRRAATGAFPLRCGFHLKPGDRETGVCDRERFHNTGCDFAVRIRENAGTHAGRWAHGGVRPSLGISPRHRRQSVRAPGTKAFL